MQKPLAEARGFCRTVPMTLDHLDLDIDARGKVQVRQRFHDAGVGIQDLDQPLMDAQLELLPGVLIDERGTVHRVALDLRRQRNRADHIGVVPLRCLNDAPRGRIDQLVIVGLDPQPYFFVEDPILSLP